jgi:hypothetical protein
MRLLTRLVLSVLLLLSGAAAYAQDGAWTVSEAKGVVTVTDSTGQRPARVGTQIAPGAIVRTGERASAVLVRGREFVTLRQNAQLRIAPAVRERGVIQILQDYGSALFNIGKQPNPHFGVETPYLAAVVKGTTFVITVTPEGASLQVTEGAVETSTLDRGVSEVILPGTVAMIAAADPLRMVVEGEGRKVLDSPARGASGAAPARTPAAGPTGPGQGPAPRIDTAIVSTPQDLGMVSGGFATGEVAVLAAVVVSDNTGRGSAPAFGSTGGRTEDGEGNGSGGDADDAGNGAGDGDVDDGNDGRANGNGAGGNGKGNNGNGNGNGGGNGNGNEGRGNGNGNGNGGRERLAGGPDGGRDLTVPLGAERR